MVLGCFSSSPIQIRHKNVTTQTCVKLFGQSPSRYLSIQIETNEIESFEASEEASRLVVTTGPRRPLEISTRLTFHEFEMTPTTAGKVVAIETFREGHFLHSSSNTPSSPLSVMSPMEGSDLRNLINSNDSRLFRITNDGGAKSKIQNIITGLYIKVENQNVYLERKPDDEVFPNSMLFEVFPYRQ